MNAYELADQLREYAGNNGYSHNDYADTMSSSANMLRQQADRIEKLESYLKASQESRIEDGKYQADRIAELEKIVKDTIGQAFYEDDFHKAEATIARQMQTVDSFAEENARLCKRITELEKVIKDGIKAFGDIQEKQLKNKLGICISAEEYQKTHEEFSTKAHERRGWEYAEELEQERRKQADRIAELEKQFDTSDKAYKWMDETYKGTLAKLEQAQSVLKELGWHEINKDGYAKLQTKPLSNDEIREIGDDCELKNNGILNWIDFARAIEERHGIK